MVFDAYEGLSDEYRSYRMIEPDQLNFRQAANDSEREAAGALSKTVGQESFILIIAGGVLVVLGVFAAFSSLGGIILALFGIPLIVFGIIRARKSKSASLVTTGVLVKKDSRTEGSVSRKDRRTHRWFVIAVDDIPNTLCIVHANPDDFNEAYVGDRILVTNDKANYRGKKMY